MRNLVQMSRAGARRVAVVEGAHLAVLPRFASLYDLATAAWAAGISLEDFIGDQSTEFSVVYDDVYEAASEWRLLVPFDHPTEPARCLVSGTGLTHIASAETRQKMHSAGEETDSIRMYRVGEEGGRPNPGTVGAAPEWFYKGNGSILRAHGEALCVPFYSEDGGEEAEVAGVYLVDSSGRPRRIGFAAGNEFSDHKTERRNYLYLAHSKLRECSIGPEIAVGREFDDLPGTVQIIRGSEVLWRHKISSGQEQMCHSLENIEHHHFKYAAHRRPGDVHIHFFGADVLSFGAGIELKDGDVAEIFFAGLGRPLRNPIRVESKKEELIRAYSA
jgi:hypothetical protein